MSQITFTLKLKTPLDVIEKRILNQLKHSLNAAINASIPNIKVALDSTITERLKASPEFSSIIGGELGAELGVQNATVVMESVVNVILTSMVITPRAVTIRSGQNLSGGLKIQILQGNFTDVLSVPGTSYTSEGGYLIPWLQWLLFAGDKIVVADYEVIFHQNPASRTGKAIMKKKRGRGYRISPAYSGTPKNNFLTRALLGIEQDIENILRVQISRRI